MTFFRFQKSSDTGAPFWTGVSLKATKAAALEDLMEAAYDGLFPRMLLLREQVGVEFLPEICGDRDRWLADDNCPLFDPVDEQTALLDSIKLNRMRWGGLQEIHQRHILQEMAPFIWVPCDRAVAFVKLRGVASLPDSWLKATANDRSTRDVSEQMSVMRADEVTFRRGIQVAGQQAPAEITEPRQRRGAPQQYDWDDAKQFVIRELDTNGDFDNPAKQFEGWHSQNDLVSKLLTYMASRAEEPSPSSAKKYVARWVSEWRRAGGQ